MSDLAVKYVVGGVVLCASAFAASFTTLCLGKEMISASARQPEKSGTFLSQFLLSAGVADACPVIAAVGAFAMLFML